MAITTTEPKPTPLERNDSIKTPAPGARLQPRRTLTRLALALAGLVAGVIGQTFLNQESLWDGLLLYGIAVILFVRALADRLFLNYQLPNVRHQLAIRTGWRRNIGIWLILLAIGLSFVSFNFFAADDARLQAWWPNERPASAWLLPTWPTPTMPA